MPRKPATVHLSKDDLEQAREKAEALREFGEVLSAEIKEQGITQEDAVRLAREARKCLAERKRNQV